jgi:hypothetical protein
VQAAIAWFAREASSWSRFIDVCSFVAQDRDRPANDVVWLFGDQHRAYLQRVIETLDSASEVGAALATATSAASVGVGSGADKYQALAEQVAEILDLPVDVALVHVRTACSDHGLYDQEVIDDATTYANGGARPAWMVRP